MAGTRHGFPQRRAYWLLLLLLSGCANYASRIRQPRFYFEAGQYDAAAEDLVKLAQRKDNDELLYLMDLGIVYHTAGRFQEAIDTFLKADKLAEIKDYTSLTQEAATVLLSDEVKPYKGEDFEKILINVYLAIDYALLRKREDALVECRRVNRKLDKMISEGKLPYERNAFAKYLAAMLFEAEGEWNDAFVDYRDLLKWKVDFPYLGVSLLRAADRLKATQEFEEYRAKFPEMKKYKIGKNEGEIILLFEQGKSPIKVPHTNFHLLPMFQRRIYSSEFAWLSVGNLPRARSHPLFDIELTAIKELEHRITLIATKKISGIVVKEIVAAQIAKQTNSKALGALTSLVLHATDQADLRSWSTLPARLHVARAIVPAGRHSVELSVATRFGNELKVKQWKELEVKPGERVFLSFRTED